MFCTKKMNYAKVFIQEVYIESPRNYRETKRNSKNTPYSNGFYLNDKVKVFNKIGWISGFTSGGCYVKDIDNNYITIPDKSYKQVGFKSLELICHNNNWQFSPQSKVYGISCQVF